MEKKGNSKGIAWFENILQTFEDVYNDVDEVMKQAESQLMTVGTSVKTFFSELGDALPQSSKDKKPGVAPDTSVAQKTVDAVGIKLQEGSGGCHGDAVGIKLQEGSGGCHGDGVHIGSVKSVKRVSSGLSSEKIDDDIEKEKCQLQTPDNIDSSNANHKIGLGIEPNSLIPASDDVGEVKSFTETENISTNLVGMSSTFSNDKRDPSDANQEIGLDSGAKLIIPASDDVGEVKFFMKTEDRSTNLVDMSSTFSNDKRDPSDANQEIGLDSGAKLIIPASDDIGGFNCIMTEERIRYIDDMASIISEVGRLFDAVEVDSLYKESTAAYLPASATDPEGLEMYDASSCEESETTRHFPREDRDNDVTKSDLQILGSMEKVEFGESCILVDSTELESSSGEAAKRSSYKKKLKDAFASKIRLLKNHNYGELKRNRSTTLVLPERSNSSDHKFCESDWEIV